MDEELNLSEKDVRDVVNSLRESGHKVCCCKSGCILDKLCNEYNVMIGKEFNYGHIQYFHGYSTCSDDEDDVVLLQELLY
jgi:hypothetical protein